MKRKLILANLVLLGLSAAIAVHIRQDWLDTQAREQATLNLRVKPVPPPPLAPPAVTLPVKPAGYIDIAQKMLFSKDRNPTVIVEAPPPPKPKPMPPFPVFHGLLDLGDGPAAILSEKAGAPHRDFRPGEKIGEFTLVAVDRSEITLEWDGKTITKKVDEILDRGAPPPPAPSPAQTAAASAGGAAATAAKPNEPAKPVAATPGIEAERGTRMCQTGDNSPAGTVAEGMRKVIKPSPFGRTCYWEPVK